MRIKLSEISETTVLEDSMIVTFYGGKFRVRIPQSDMIYISCINISMETLLEEAKIKDINKYLSRLEVEYVMDKDTWIISSVEDMLKFLLSIKERILNPISRCDLSIFLEDITQREFSNIQSYMEQFKGRVNYTFNLKNNMFKLEDKVQVKSLAWYEENKDENGDIWNKDKSNMFWAGMTEYCGNTYTIRYIFKDQIVLDDEAGNHLKGIFYPEWLEDGDVSVPEKLRPDEAIYKVTLTKARRYFQSANSDLQEIAMSCFSINQLNSQE